MSPPVAFVGEGPGENEEWSGRPFVGNAGAMLDWLLEHAHASRRACYVTNAALHKPRRILVDLFEQQYASKKDVLKQSVYWCRPRLLHELAAVRPKVVIAVGNHALESLTGWKGVEALQGCVLPVDLQWLARTCHHGPAVQWDRKRWAEIGAPDLTPAAASYVVPMVHPAYLLRGATRHIHACIRVIQKAFRLARDGMREHGTFLPISPYHPRGDVVLDELDYYVDQIIARQLPIVIDVETTHADAKDATLTVFGFAADALDVGVAVTVLTWNRATERFQLAWTPQQWQRVDKAIRRLCASRVEKWYWNYSFDVTVLERYYGDVLQGPHHDGMHWHWAMQPDLPHRLEYAAQTYLDIEPWKRIYREKERRGEATQHDLLIYNCQDTLYTAKVIPYLKNEVRERRNEHVIEHQRAVAELARRAELHGVPIHKPTFSELYKEHETARDEALAVMRQTILSKPGALQSMSAYVHKEKCRDAAQEGRGQPDFVELSLDDFNPRSKYYGRWYLYELCEIPLQRWTAGGADKEEEKRRPSHSYKGVLMHLRDPRIKAYVDYSEENYWIVNLESLHAKVVEDPEGTPDYWRLYVRWNSCGIKGTRWSSKILNLQNWMKKARRIIRAKPGRKWVGCDAAQIEYRVAACLAGIKDLITMFNLPPFDENDPKESWKKYDGRYDAHSMVGEWIFEDQWRNASLEDKKKLRTFVKRVVYALFYGAHPEKILTTIREDRKVKTDMRAGVTLALIDKIWNGFKARFPEWDRWATREMHYASTRGYQEFPPLWRKRYWPVKEVEENKIRNTPIQLSAGDIVNLYFIAIEKRIRAEGLDAVMAIHGHDAGYWDCAEAHAERVSQIVAEEFQSWLDGPGGKVYIYGQPSIGDTVADVG